MTSAITADRNRLKSPFPRTTVFCKMPPKQPPKGRSAKSGKLSKAEKEKLKKEEAERKAREEEEARLKEEQEKKEQEERERLEREEKQKLWEAEKARHQVELDEINEILENNAQQLKSLEEAQRSKAKWERYMLCDGSPDPLIENELNTFMHLWRDEVLPKSARDVLLECENTLQLIDEMEFHIKDEELTDEELQRYKESVKKLQDLIGFKIDRATMDLLLSASDNVDPESQNLQYLSSTEHITLCVWGNTAKNPRLKSVTFDKLGFTIDVPKTLAIGEVSIRVLLTAYDHLSPSAKSFYPKQKKIPEVVVEIPQDNEEDKKEEGEEESKEQEEEQLNAITPKSASVVSRASKASKAKSGRTGSSKSSRSRKASAKSAKSQSSEQTANKDSAKEPESEEPAGDNAATKTEQSVDDAPPELSNLEEYYDEDDDEDDDDVLDLRAFGVVGPIMFLELLELPPQPKHVKTWTIQQIVSPDLKRLPYQTQSSSAPGSASSSGPHPTSASNSNIQSSNPPLAITLRLPGNVVYFEQPQLAWWEPTKSQWRLDGLADITYNEEERTMSFKTMGFGPIATTQDLYLNMPFQSWEIRPHKTNSCVFTVIAAIIEMEIEIKDGLCCLSQPDDIEELTCLIGKWMKPKELMKALQGAGVNVFPAEDAEKYVSINKKDEKLENDVYREVALTASSYAYSWSKWNADSGVDKIVLQTAEQLQDELLLEEDWSLYLLTTQSSCKLKMKEDDAEFSDNSADNTQLHSNLYHMVKEEASQEAKQRIQDSSFLFVDCVYQLLSATKVITYS